MFNLAVSFARGDGVCEDMTKAFYWYGEAAKRGHGYGLYQYGRMLFEGEGVMSEPERGIAYVFLAAELNQREACKYVYGLHGETLALRPTAIVEQHQQDWQAKHTLPSMNLFPTCDDLS